MGIRASACAPGTVLHDARGGRLVPARPKQAPKGRARFRQLMGGPSNIPKAGTQRAAFRKSIWGPVLKTGTQRAVFRQFAGKLLSATRTPPATSIIDINFAVASINIGSKFQLGIHNLQRTRHAAGKASHFRYRASRIQSLCRAHGGPHDQFRVSKLPWRTNSAIYSTKNLA